MTLSPTETHRTLNVNIKILDSRVGQSIDRPRYMSDAAAGMDVRAVLDTAVTLEPGQRLLIGCGFALEFPEGYECQVRPRSGLAIKHGITVANAPGTIDADYRGEVKVALINIGSESYTIAPNERIAQLVFAPVLQAQLNWVESISETQRGAGGFGSTGRIASTSAL